jgi:ectoine hydroxylase-related dioxygenase (phytanoyl-CoA dioxygenase family)
MSALPIRNDMCLWDNELNEMWKQTVEHQGFVVTAPLLTASETASLADVLNQPTVSRSRAGVRHALGLSGVASVARDSRLLSIAKEILGAGAFPYHATLFDKSPTSNWLVVWHQDTALPLRERKALEGWGPWSVKEGVNYAHAPASALRKVLALRVHLDDSTEHNGPLRVLPGTHRRGVLSDEEIERIVPETTPVECVVRKGGVLAMRPVLVHSSSKSHENSPRRVLHIEYAASVFPVEGLELAVA